MKKTIMVEQHKFWAVFTTFIAYVCWIFVYQYYEGRNNISIAEITMVSRVGVVIIMCYVVAWRKLTGEYFTLFNVFLAFYVVFNFGQCLLWAVGIHTDDEIGKALIFYTVSANNNLILRAQLLSIICFITLNCGGFLVWSKRETLKIQTINSDEAKLEREYKCLYYTALILSFISVPATLYNAISRLIYAQKYGYHDLYYGDVARLSDGPIITILSSLFLPCLLGLLIGSKYKKNVRLVTYGIFGIYAIITMLAGDRGEWINYIVILIWADFHLYKKRNIKTIITLGVVCFILLYAMEAIVDLRNIGVTWEGFIEVLTSYESNPVVSMLTEFGKSMGISIILLKENVVFPYGNSFLMAIPTMFGTGLLKRVFGIEYMQLGSWFSHVYLDIQSGTDFTIVGEALLNFGVYATPIVLLVEGMIIGRIAQSPYRKMRNPLMMCICLGITAVVLKIARSILWSVLNSVVFFIIIFIMTYIVVKTFFLKK